jgi:iron complex transport system ATP-binding protein
LRELVLDGMAVLVSTHHPDHALYLADSAVLMTRAGVRAGPTTTLLTETALSDLYGIPCRAVDYLDGENGVAVRRTIVTKFDESVRVAPAPDRASDRERA